MINTYSQSTNLSYAYSPKFKGQATHEILKIGNKERIIRHETAFFREYNTMKKSVEYLKKTFPDVSEPQIIIGACSSGEQALSVKMLLKGQKPHILGFDISKKSIDEANSLTYKIYQPKDEKSRKNIQDRGLSAYNDEFLAFDIKKQTLSKTQQKLKKIFNQTFVETKPESEGLNTFSMYMKKIRCFISGFKKPKFIVKTFKPRNPNNLGCKFVEGDIQSLDKIAPEGKAHMLSFSNALYHLITEDVCCGADREQLPKEEAMSIIKNVAKQVNKALIHKGLFTLGEHEDLQMTDMQLVSNVLKESGFKKVTGRKGTYCNMWAKYKDVQ